MHQNSKIYSYPKDHHQQNKRNRLCLYHSEDEAHYHYIYQYQTKYE